MDRYVLSHRLRHLAKEGARLKHTSKERSELWFARADDALKLCLPSDSELLKAFKDIRAESQKDPHRGVPSVAPAIIRTAVELANFRDDDSLAALRRDVHSVITDIYMKAWWFYVPVAILLAALGYALFGVIQLRSIKVDVRAEAESARQSIERGRLEVEKSVTNEGAKARSAVEDVKQQLTARLQEDLKTYASREQTRMAGTVDKHIGDIAKAVAPRFETQLAKSQITIANLEKQSDDIQRQLATIKQSSTELQRAIDGINGVTNTTSKIERLRIYLGHSRSIIFGEFVVATVTLLLSIVLLIFSLKR